MEAVTVDEGLEIIHPLIEKAMRESGTPGMSLVVVTPEETVFRNYGYADREQETAADSSTLFELGSMSKAFTALGILLLEQEGKLGLDDDIREYIPWLALQFNGNYKGQKIDGEVPLTVGDFLYQTTGIPFDTVGYIPIGNADRDRAGLLSWHPPFIRHHKLRRIGPCNPKCVRAKL